MDTLAVLATVAGLLWLAWYLIACWLWPFADCRRCRGSGKRRSPSGKAFRLCRRCKRTGRRVRTGRKVWNWLRQRQQEGAP